MYAKYDDGRIKELLTGEIFDPTDNTDIADQYRAWLDAGNIPEIATDTPPGIVLPKPVLVEALIKAGLASTLEQMLNQAPAEIRQAWYAYQEINLSDPRIVEFFTSANIDINAIIRGE